MAYSKTEAIAFELSRPIAEKNNCFIYDVEFVKESGLYFLRIYVDKQGGISVDECEKISRELSVKLDEKDPIKQNYYLEVSSPGIERKLKNKEHFDTYVGEKIDIGLYKALNGRKQIRAILKCFDGENITIELDNGEVVDISKKETTFVKLHFDF